MTQPYLGEIRTFPYNFAPNGWATCDGQLIPISQNTALFALLGTYYGGDGKSNFALPNLQGHAVMHQGQGPGLSDRVLGEVGGVPNVTLIVSEMPAHSHTVRATGGAGNQRAPFPTDAPADRHWSASGHDQYSATGSSIAMNPGNVGLTGGSQPHNNESPYLVVLYCIAIAGIFPQRN